MSSNDQAFVKAFARRNRAKHSSSVQNQTQVEPHHRELDQSPMSLEVTEDAPEVVEEGSLTVDQSVASTTQVWIDPIEDLIVRADQAMVEIPKPHLNPPAALPPGSEPQVRPDTSVLHDDPVSPSLQHIHTAYATAYTDVEPVSLPQRVPTESERMPRETPTAPEPETAPAELTVETHASVADSYLPFQAAWEVDVFDIPTNVADLFFEGHLFQQIAEQMSVAVGTGLKSVLVTSASSGEGRSTVAIGMAMAAAAAGIRVALVDADTEDPTLVDDLRLDLEYGWVDTIRSGLHIKEVAVRALEDGVTLIPLMPPRGSTTATPFEVLQLIELLQNKFELIVIDGPVGASSSLHQCASAVDSAIIVRDMTRTDTLTVSEFSSRLQAAGVNGIGIVENFT